MDYNNDFKYDLKVGQVAEQELGNIFNNSTIEVKFDQQATTTGNVYVEYQSRGNASGIATSEAEYYCFAFNKPDESIKFHLIKTSELKTKCRKYIKTWRDRKGGDNNTSLGILLPTSELL